jgi:hypothetical protein
MVQEYKAYRLIPLMTPLFNGWTIPLRSIAELRAFYSYNTVYSSRYKSISYLPNLKLYVIV